MYIITDVILGDMRNAKHYPLISRLVMEVLNLYIVKNKLTPPQIVHAEMEHVEHDVCRRIIPGSDKPKVYSYDELKTISKNTTSCEVEIIQAEFTARFHSYDETVGITKKAREILNTKG